MHCGSQTKNLEKLGLVVEMSGKQFWFLAELSEPIEHMKMEVCHVGTI